MKYYYYNIYENFLQQKNALTKALKMLRYQDLFRF